MYWGAVLIEAVRVDGKPRQRYVAYLGGFTEHGIEHAHQRCRFWDRVNERLRALSHRLTDEDRNHIVTKLATRVPVPTRQDHAKLFLRYHRSGTSSSARISFLLCAPDVEEIFTPPPL